MLTTALLTTALSFTWPARTSTSRRKDRPHHRRFGCGVGRALCPGGERRQSLGPQHLGRHPGVSPQPQALAAAAKQGGRLPTRGQALAAGGHFAGHRQHPQALGGRAGTRSVVHTQRGAHARRRLQAGSVAGWRARASDARSATASSGCTASARSWWRRRPASCLRLWPSCKPGRDLSTLCHP
jgi:hypothetical protein